MERLLEAAAERGVTGPSALAKALNESDQVLANWGRRGISKDGFAKVQKVLGISSYWLMTGEGSADADAGGSGSQETPYLPGFESLSIPVLANSGSMGAGEDQLHDEVVVGRLTVSPGWVQRTIKSLTKPENLRFIHGWGDSMDPTFCDGDILLVDVGVQAVRIDGIYVLEANDRIYIKRVRQRMDGNFEVSSDNSTVKTVDVLDGSRPINVRGRVVWCWNGKKM